jgi:hypothetical protein
MNVVCSALPRFVLDVLSEKGSWKLESDIDEC